MSTPICAPLVVPIATLVGSPSRCVCITCLFGMCLVTLHIILAVCLLSSHPHLHIVWMKTASSKCFFCPVFRICSMIYTACFRILVMCSSFSLDCFLIFSPKAFPPYNCLSERTLEVIDSLPLPTRVFQ